MKDFYLKGLDLKGLGMIWEMWLGEDWIRLDRIGKDWIWNGWNGEDLIRKDSGWIMNDKNDRKDMKHYNDNGFD